MVPLSVAITWTSSADKHSIPREDAVYAIAHAESQTHIEGYRGEVAVLYIGHPHPQTHRYIEVIATLVPPRGVVIFHVMDLSDTYRYLLAQEDETQ